MESENQTFSYEVERARKNSNSLLWSPINIINIEELCVQEWTSHSSAQHGQWIWLHVWRRDANLHSATFVYSKGTRGRDDHHEHASADCPTDKSSAAPCPGHLEPGEVCWDCRAQQGSSIAHHSTLLFFAHGHTCFRIWSSSSPTSPFPFSHMNIYFP